MGVDNNQLRQKLLKKYNYFSRYCNNIKTKEDFLLSKQEIENGLHEDSKTLFRLRQELFDLDPNRIDFDDKGVLKRAIVPKIRSLDGYKLSLLDLGMEANPYSRQEEELQINYYYNTFVYAMTRVISLALFFDEKKDKLKWDREYSLAYKSISTLEDISGEIYGNDFRIIQEWNYFESLCDVTKDKPQVLFGRMTQFTHYKPKTNPTIQEMLGWMDIADSILTKKRKVSVEQGRESEEKAVGNDAMKIPIQTQEDNFVKPNQKEKSYDKKSTYLTILSAFLILASLLIDSRLFLLVALLIVGFGLKRVFSIKPDKQAPFFSVDNSIKDKIKQVLERQKMNIDIPFYGFEKVSNNIVDEVYHFFKDKKTQFEVPLTIVKEFELPYDEMDAESLYIMTKRYKKYSQQEKDGFAELQKIKSYGMVLENVK